MYQSLITRRRDQGFKIYKLKKNLSWLRVLQTVCNLYIFYYYYFIIRDEFEFNVLEYCVLISVLNLNNINTHSRKFMILLKCLHTQSRVSSPHQLPHACLSQREKTSFFFFYFFHTMHSHLIFLSSLGAYEMHYVILKPHMPIYHLHIY